MPLSAVVSGSQGERQRGAGSLIQSHEQRWRHEAGWFFPVLSLGTSTPFAYTGCAMSVCADLFLGTNRSISHSSCQRNPKGPLWAYCV